jgi:hypothetical protein
MAVTIERPQSRYENQVAGLRSPEGASFVPIAASHEKSELTFIFELGNRQTFEEQASTFGLAVSWAP